MVKLIIFLLSVMVSRCGEAFEAFGCMECFNGGSGIGVSMICMESEDCGGDVVEESAGDDDCNENVDAAGLNAEYAGQKPSLADEVSTTEEDKTEIETVSKEETDKKEKELMETAEITESTDKNGEKENVGEVMADVDNEDKNNDVVITSNVGNDKNTAEKGKTSADKKNKKLKDDKGIARYNPDRVVKLAIKKCKAGGMITTEQDLKKKLKAGKITKEEYDEYYPLGGMEGSYYSVFVNVDLNKATTISGERLKSEEEIASHIAGMMLLENDKLFNITYAGIYKTKENEFYEFRCHR